jgi:hypothetical protein
MSGVSTRPPGKPPRPAGRVVFLTGAQDPLEVVPGVGRGQQIVKRRVHDPRVPGDDLGKDPTTRPQDPRRLGQSRDSVVPLHEVVERAHHQRRIDGAVGERKVPRLSLFDLERCLRLGGGPRGGRLNVARHRVDQHHVMTAAREIRGVGSRAAANVGDTPPVGQEAVEDVPCPQPHQVAESRLP